jgi:hypothetical protein
MNILVDDPVTELRPTSVVVITIAFAMSAAPRRLSGGCGAPCSGCFCAAIVCVRNGRQVLLPIIRLPLTRMRSPLSMRLVAATSAGTSVAPCVPSVRCAANRISFFAGVSGAALLSGAPILQLRTRSQTNLSRSPSRLDPVRRVFVKAAQQNPLLVLNAIVEVPGRR